MNPAVVDIIVGVSYATTGLVAVWVIYEYLLDLQERRGL